MLAGLALDRTVVQFPVWRDIGLNLWAGFALHSELGRGVFLYPAQGIGALLCCVVAAVTFYLTPSVPRAASVPIYGAAILAIAALVVTGAGVVPRMLSLKEIGSDPAAIQHVFAGVERWWAAKAILHALTFLANVWSLMALGCTPKAV